MPKATDEPGTAEARVARFLEAVAPHWACRTCMANTLTVPVRDVKIGLLRLARFRSGLAVESACEMCAGCHKETAVVRAGAPRHLRRVA